MKIELQEIPIRELFDGYTNNFEEGVIGYHRKLNIRPKYQREFIYKDKQKCAVIDTIRKNFPLNVMYWVKNNDGYELLDGQQRTISICSYIAGDWAINYQFFFNLEEDEKNQILDYKLMIYICEGEDSEKLDWFQTINIAGEKLTDQELRNAIYTGAWLESAKRYFSKTQCPAFKLAENYMKGTPIRQEYLETVIRWISNNNIDNFMALNQNKPDCNLMWIYFQSVINWVKTIFPDYQKEMKGIEWGLLYNKYKDQEYNIEALKTDIKKLMMDDDVTKKSGIFEYLLSNKKEEKALSIRSFTEAQKRTAYAKCNGICAKCGEPFDYKNCEFDHIVPWKDGGRTTVDNLQVLCKHCNRVKGAK